MRSSNNFYKNTFLNYCFCFLGANSTGVYIDKNGHFLFFFNWQKIFKIAHPCQNNTVNEFLPCVKDYQLILIGSLWIANRLHRPGWGHFSSHGNSLSVRKMNFFEYINFFFKTRRLISSPSISGLAIPDVSIIFFWSIEKYRALLMPLAYHGGDVSVEWWNIHGCYI